MPPVPFDIPLDHFLHGFDPNKNIVKDYDFFGTFEEFWSENAVHTIPDVRLEDLTVIDVSDVVSGITYLEINDGVVAVTDSFIPIGCYWGHVLCLSKAWQGQGIGRELVIHRCIQAQENPCCLSSDITYSKAGYAAHISAWTSLQ